jgi:hypothetical protein
VPGPGQPTNLRFAETPHPRRSREPGPVTGDPVLEFLPKIAKQRELAAAADRAVIATPEDKKKQLRRAFDAVEEKIYELEDKMAEIPATTVPGVIAKLQIPAALYRDLAKDSITRGEHNVLLTVERFSEGEALEVAIARLEPAAKEFRDRAGNVQEEMPSHEHLVIGALADLRRLAEIDPVLTLLEKRNDADRRATALDKLRGRNPEQDAAFEAADRECGELEDRIARTSSKTLSGVIAKLGLIETTGGDSTLVQGAIADLRRFEKKASIARTAALV